MACEFFFNHNCFRCQKTTYTFKIKDSITFNINIVKSIFDTKMR